MPSSSPGECRGYGVPRHAGVHGLEVPLLLPDIPDEQLRTSLRPKPNPKNSKVFEVVKGQTTAAREQEQMACSHTEDPVVEDVRTRLGEVQCRSASIPNKELALRNEHSD